MTVLAGILVLTGVCLAFGILIAAAYRKLRVYEDPRIDAVTDMLPAANCGACGYAGCRAFAEAAVAGIVEPAVCTVMSADDRDEVAEYLGVDAGQANRRVARLLCAGGSHVAIQQAEYRGLPTCAAAAAVAGGGKGCTWGCLGLADCERACDFDAITMNAWGLPVVDPVLCTACGDCVDACPKDLFTVMPEQHRLLVQCASLLGGDAIEDVCKVACNACGRCVVDAAPGLIEMKEGLAVVDYGSIELANHKAIERCPTGAIVWLEGAQFGSEVSPQLAGSLAE